LSQKHKHEQPIGEADEVQEQTQPEEKTPEASEETGEEKQPEAERKEPEKTEAELLEEQVSQLGDKLLRTMAEYDNFRKRSQKEKEAIYPQATANAVAQFVPIIDTFERALAVECADAEFKKGVEMILQNFKDVLEKLGVEAFGAAGEQFNPDLHNAVMHIDDESLETNIITDVFQKGYKIGDRIIRHAMVKVAN
jgi:molecular chaperone GrpE